MYFQRWLRIWPPKCWIRLPKFMFGGIFSLRWMVSSKVRAIRYQVEGYKARKSQPDMNIFIAVMLSHWWNLYDKCETWCIGSVTKYVTRHIKKEKTANIIELNTREQERITKNGYRHWIQRWKCFKNWLLSILSFFGRRIVIIDCD